MDYKAFGFRAGIECHQQLDTKQKLFCDCPTERSENFPLQIERKLRAVAGELGFIDEAARYEFAREKTFIYKSNQESACEIEMDEAPPKPLNEEALETTLQICKLLNAEIIDELHVMRKTVIDGSCVSGFQRTVLVGMNGFVETSKGKIKIPTIQLEEDAATMLEKKGDTIIYRLDRLGIPLVELGTDSSIVDPEHLKETALTIGMLLRSTGNVKRGIGTIRQDINISIARGNRVEIKGAQDLHLFPEIAKREIQRQLNLLEIRDDLHKRKAAIDKKIYDVSKLFKKKTLAIKLKNFSGILRKELQPGRRLGKELAEHAIVVGAGGIIHTDEDLKKYKIDEANLRKDLHAKQEDAIIIVSGDRAEKALQFIIRRLEQLFEGVPKEARKVLQDGNTAFMRPMPGAARLYPETDIPPILITRERKQKIPLPEKPEQTRRRLLTLNLSKDLTQKLLASENLAIFNRVKTKHPALLASTLEDTLPALRREGINTDLLDDEHFIELFSLYDKRLFAKENIPDILRAIVFNQDKPIKDIVENLFIKLDEKTIREKIKKIIQKNKNLLKEYNAFNKIMGEVMKELRGKADGKLISKLVQEEIK